MAQGEWLRLALQRRTATQSRALALEHYRNTVAVHAESESKSKTKQAMKVLGVVGEGMRRPRYGGEWSLVKKA